MRKWEAQSHIDKILNVAVEEHRIKRSREDGTKHTFLGLLAKIKCSICSYQFNI